MANEGDLAAVAEAIHLAEAMDRHQRQARLAPRLAPSGYCHNPLCCLDLEVPQALFCGPECEREYQRLRKR